MLKKPQIAFLVSDLSTSVSFYQQLPSFTIAEHPVQDVVYVIDADDDPFLLVGPLASDVAAYLAVEHFILKPGEQLHFAYHDLQMLRYVLQHPQVKGAQIVERRWGGHKLTVQDPDGFILTFFVRPKRSSEETLSLYIESVAELEKALLNLSEDDLNLSLTSDSWSIRRIVHHLADSETIFCWGMKLALSESGRIFKQYFPDSNDPLSALSSPTRPIQPSLDLIRAMRAHIAQLALDIPDAMERYTVDAEGDKATFGNLASMLLRHMAEHLDEIEAIRLAHAL